MAQGSGIKWKKGDYIKLGRAISEFNKKIREIETEENEVYLPAFQSYEEMKESIATRREFNRYINSLKRFQKPTEQRLYITEAGETMTVWERRNLERMSKRRIKSLEEELSLLNKPVSGSNFSRAQMGSVRVQEIKSQIESLKEVETQTGYELKRLKEKIMNQGRSDFEFRKAIVYRENYIKEMEKYQNFENYNLLVKKLNSIKDPIKFFEYVSQTEITGDLTYNSDMYYSQADFNYFLNQLGIALDETLETM